MKYQVGDLFIDTRGKETRNFLLTEVITKELERLYYRFYISPDDKEDVWSEGILKLYVDKYILLHYPAANE